MCMIHTSTQLIVSHLTLCSPFSVAVPSLTCTDYVVTPEGSRMEVIFTRAVIDVESTDLDSNTCMIDVVPSYGCNCTDPLEEFSTKSSNLTDTSTESSNLTDSFTESSNFTSTSTDSSSLTNPSTETTTGTSIELSTLTDTYNYKESNNLAGIIASTIGVMTFICGFSFATTCICYHVMIRRKKALKKEKGISTCMAAVPQQTLECGEITSDTWKSGRTFGLLHTFKGVTV